MSTTPEPTGHPLADVADSFLQAWNRRSADERTRFLSRLSGSAASAGGPELRAVRERAALCGAVAPQDLVRDHSPDAAARLLDLSSHDFDRTSTPDGWRWTLRSGARREALSRLVADGRVATVLATVEELPTDSAGALLRRIAAGRVGRDTATPPVPDSTGSPAVVQALSWARPLGGVAADLAEQRRRSAAAALRDSYEELRRYGVIGRDDELGLLRAFAAAPGEDTRTDVPLAYLAGIGGAGKSTVIAELIRTYLDGLAQPGAGEPIVVVIDFDRVRFRGDAQLELSFELSRQLGWAVPEAGADFSVLRYQMRKQRTATAGDAYLAPDEREDRVRESSAFDSEARTIVDLHGLGDRPVLLVLDTFEEWQSRRIDPERAGRDGWNDPETRVWNWVSAVRHTMGLRGLRVLVSGRADPTLAGRYAGVDLDVPLGDLTPAHADTLLATQGVPDEGRAALAEVVGGNPLRLRVAARFFLRLPPDGRAAFLAGAADDLAALEQELRGAVLYDRFLEHLPEDLRTLAHPGLVLRRVTPELVRAVVAPNAGLPGLSAAAAEALTERLADQVWLVKRTGDGLSHQPNMRRTMLRLMQRDPSQAGTIRAIHAAAVDWYAVQPDGSRRETVLPAAEADTEWFYHSLLLDPEGWRTRLADPTQRARWAVLAVALGAGVEDLPGEVGPLVRYLRNDPLTVDEAAALPRDLAHDWTVRQGAELSRLGRPEEALALVDAERRRFLPDEPPWLAQAYCEAGRWPDYWPADVGKPAPERSGRYAAMNAICAGDPGHRTRFLDEVMRVMDGGRAGTPEDWTERAFFRLVVEQRPGPWLRNLARWDPVTADRYPVDQLRRMQLWLAGGRTEAFVLTRLAGLLRPDLEWLERFALATGLGRPSWLDKHLEYLRALAGDLPSIDTLVGEAALRFARYTYDRIDVPAGSVVPGPELIDALRGDNPELRPAVIRALVSAVGTGSAHELAELAQSVLPIPVSDLRPEVVPPAGDPRLESTISQLVHIVDRSGVLVPFLATATGRLPGAEPLHRVERAVSAWDEAQRRLLDLLVLGSP